jgi:hypothetical protein
VFASSISLASHTSVLSGTSAYKGLLGITAMPTRAAPTAAGAADYIMLKTSPRRITSTDLPQEQS